MSELFWVSSSGRIELAMTLEQAQSASHSGPCDEDVDALSQVSEIAEQLGRLSASTLAQELREYGAWDADQLADHEQNLQRLVWIAAGDLSEEACINE